MKKKGDQESALLCFTMSVTDKNFLVFIEVVTVYYLKSTSKDFNVYLYLGNKTNLL